MLITKMQCIGNDFLVANCFYDKIENPSVLAREICDRHFGIGADGLVLLLYSNDADFRTEFYNPYGVKSKCTPNMLICAVKYALDNDLVNKLTVSVDTDDGVKYLTVSDSDKVEITTNCGLPVLTPQLIPVDYTGEDFINKVINIFDKSYQLTCVSVQGNPCAVMFTENGEELNEIEIGLIAPYIEKHNIFPSGCNVIISNVVDRNLLQARCWVLNQGEVIGCDFGATAALVAATLCGYTDDKVAVELHGGDVSVEISDDDFIYLTANADKVFEIEW